MFILLIIGLSLIVLFWYANFFWHERYLRKFPGPRPLPIFGSLLDFVNPLTRMPRLLKYREIYKGDYKMYFGFEPAVFISNPKSLESLLSSTTNLKKPKPYFFLKNWLGNGLLLSEGDYWRKHRKIITPAFHFQILEKYVETFNATTDVLIKILEKKVDVEAFDIFPYIGLFTLDIMCEAAMSTSVNAQLNSDSKYVLSVQEMGRIFMERGFSVLQRYDFLYKFFPNYRREEKAVNVLHTYAYNIIDKKKEENKHIQSENELSSKKKLSLLDLMLYHNSKTNSLSNDELREEMDTLLFEGHGTTASTISFTLYNLAVHQNIQEKAYEEIFSIFGGNAARPATFNDLNNMKYLEMIIKETLRLYPPAPFYSRELTMDFKCDDKIIPKGMTVHIDSIGIHRDPNFFPNPENFDPNRFLPENCKDRNPYVFIPFSAGPRNCIGQKFAMLEIKSAISKLLRHYKILSTVPAQKLILQLHAHMTSRNGFMISLKKR